MLKSFRRLLARGSASPELSTLQQWAEGRNHGFRRVRDSDGCVIDGKQGAQAAMDNAVTRGNKVLREFEKSVRG